MAVSQTAEYALRAVLRLAQMPTRPQTTHQLAESTRVPQSYLPKVLQPLTRVGIVSAQRGSQGGYTLRRDPKTLSVLEVVSCVDPVEQLPPCTWVAAEQQGMFCGLHKMLDDIQTHIRTTFSTTFIDTLLHPPTGAAPPLCSSANHDNQPSRRGGHPSLDGAEASLGRFKPDMD